MSIRGYYQYYVEGEDELIRTESGGKIIPFEQRK